MEAVLPLLLVASVAALAQVLRRDEVLRRHRLVEEHNIRIRVVPASPPHPIEAGLQVPHILEGESTFRTETSESTGISRCTAPPSVLITSGGRFMADLVHITRR